MGIPNDLPKGDEARAGEPRRDGPLDGSTSGTIGGGGPDTGGSTPRPHDRPAVHPGDAASGRLAPDPLAATDDPDPPSVTGTESVRSVASGPVGQEDDEAGGSDR
jgi:hypothetical protein